VDAANASSWIDAGAQGLGIGSSLYKPGDSPATVRERAETLISSLRSAGKE
jgi:2-dehydro-3-deoxyphosphogalactonate aldolase